MTRTHTWVDKGGEHTELGFRTWIRNNLPHARDGYVVEDLDLVVRVYGNQFKTDSKGQYMLIELKYGSAQLGVAQVKTFSLIDSQLRQADPDGVRYKGYYVVNYTNEDWDDSSFKINGRAVTFETFYRFMMFEDVGIESLFGDI